MIDNITYKPSSFLSNYIDRFYVFKKQCNDNFELPCILPGTGLELLFHLDKPLSINNKKLPINHSVCPRQKECFDKHNNLHFLSVRFKSGAFRHFTKTPFSQLNNEFLSLQNLWDEHAESIENALKNKNTIPLKIKKIESFLIKMFDKHHNHKNDKWDEIIDDLYYNFNSLTIEKLAQKNDLSLRHFERGFKKQFGTTAKQFQKTARFQSVIKQVLLNKKPNYLFTILDTGYFDQSHFIKEFKSLTGKTPSQYFVQENFESNFYHNSSNTTP